MEILKSPCIKKQVEIIGQRIYKLQKVLGDLGCFGFLKYSKLCRERAKRQRESSAVSRKSYKEKKEVEKSSLDDLKTEWYQYGWEKGYQDGIEEAESKAKSKPDTPQPTNKWNIPSTYRRNRRSQLLPPCEFWEEFQERRLEESRTTPGSHLAVKIIGCLQKYLAEEKAKIQTPPVQEIFKIKIKESTIKELPVVEETWDGVTTPRTPHVPTWYGKAPALPTASNGAVLS